MQTQSKHPFQGWPSLGSSLSFLAILVLVGGLFIWGAAAWWGRWWQTGPSEITALLQEGSPRLAKIRGLSLGHDFVSQNPLLWARVLRLNGDLVDAGDALRIAASRAPADRLLDLERALLRLENGEWGDNLELVFRLESALPTEEETIKEGLVRSFLRQLQPGQAKTVLDSWEQAGPSIRFHLETARLKEFTEDHAGCLEELDKALALIPDHAEALGWKGRILVILQKNQQALETLDQALRLLPEQADWELARAVALDNLGRPTEAKEALERLLNRDGKQAQAWADLGRIELLDGRLRQARDALEKALALEPGNTMAAVNLRKTYFQLGLEKEATEMGQRLTRLETDQGRIRQLVQVELQKRPNDPDVFHELATLFLRSGYPKSAIFWCQKALSIAPNHRPSHELIAGYYEATGNPGLAADHRRKSQPKSPTEPKGSAPPS